MKKWVIIAISAVVVLAIVLTTVGVVAGIAIYNNQPEVVVRNAVTGATEGLLKRDEVEPMLNMLQKGSLELNVTMDSEKMGEGFDENSVVADVGGKFYFSKDSVFMENLHADIKNSDSDENLKFNAELYANNEYVYIYNDEFLNGAYGFIKGSMAESFKRSYIAENLTEEQIEIISALLESYEGENAKDLQKDAEKISARYEKLLTKSITKHARFESDNKKIEFDGQEVNSREITVTIDGATILAVFTDLYNEQREDEDLREFFIKYSANFKGTNVFGEEDFDPNDAGKIYDDWTDELGDALEDFENEVEDSDEALIIRVVTPTTSSTLRRLTVSVDDGSSEEDVFELDLGKKGIEKTNLIKVTVDGNTVYTFEVKEDNSKYYHAVLQYSKESSGYLTNDVNKTLFSINIDKDKNTVRMKFDDDEVIVSGSWETKSRVTTIVINEFETDGQKIEDGIELTVVLDEKDSMPKPKKKDEVKNIFEMKEKDFEAIAERIEDHFGESATY